MLEWTRFLSVQSSNLVDELPGLSGASAAMGNPQLGH